MLLKNAATGMVSILKKMLSILPEGLMWKDGVVGYLEEAVQTGEIMNAGLSDGMNGLIISVYA